MQDGMPFFRRVFNAAVSIGLFISFLSAHDIDISPASAQAAPSPPQVQELQLDQGGLQSYAARLTQARAVQGALQNCVAAIEARDAALTSQNNALERELGTYRTREDALVARVISAEALYTSSQQTYAASQRKYEDQVRKLNKVRAQRDALVGAYNKCKRDAWIFGFVCDMANEISGMRAQIDKLGGAIAATRKKLVSDRDGARAAETAYRNIATAREALRKESFEVTGNIQRIEGALVTIKKTLSEARAEFQENRVVVDEFDKALREAEAVDTEDDRRRTARKIARLSGRLDDLMTRTPAILDRGRTTLAPGAPGCTAAG